MTAHDSFVFALGGANHWPSNDAVDFGKSAFANIYAGLTGVHQDAFSNPATHDAAHEAHWLALHDFHLI
jgi:hypothetical protein